MGTKVNFSVANASYGCHRSLILISSAVKDKAAYTENVKIEFYILIAV